MVGGVLKRVLSTSAARPSWTWPWKPALRLLGSEPGLTDRAPSGVATIATNGHLSSLKLYRCPKVVAGFGAR